MSDCGCDTSDVKLVPYEEALQNLLDHAQTVSGLDSVSTLDALNRILADDLSSTINVPPAANSSMDGYAIRLSDVNNEGVTRLEVTQRIPAGETGSQVEAGNAARIFTGAPIPPGADAVIMQEHVSTDGDTMSFEADVTLSQNIRDAGEDIKISQLVLEQGKRLLAQDLGLAASIGHGKLNVTRKIRVGIFFTGDELVEPGNPLSAGKIYDSNRYTLTGLLRSMDCDIVDLGIVGDTLTKTKEALQQASQNTDLIITSGGVSVGEEDYVRVALEELGTLNMWRIKIKPGKPLAFGVVNETAFLGLPGNPVSVFATFCLFVSPYIKRLQGRSDTRPLPINVTAGFDWPRPDSRREFARARLVRDDQNQLIAELYPSQSSGVLMSTSWADGFVVIPEDSRIQSGDSVHYYSFRDMLS
mgnify:CR=1 FL=1